MYIEDQVKVLTNIVVEADPILTEMCSVLNEFEQINKKKASDSVRKPI